MEKEEFVRKIIQKFYNELAGQREMYLSDGKRLLPNNVDYDKAYDLFLQEYSYRNPPQIATLMSFARRCTILKSIKEKKINNLYAYKNEKIKYLFSYNDGISYKDACYIIQKQHSKIDKDGELHKAFIKFEKVEA